MIGLGLLVLFPPDPKLAGEVLTAEREATFVRGMAELLPTGIKGLMLTGMLAALASTVDTHLNWGSSYWTNDIYKRFICEGWLKRKPTGRTLVWVARGANLLILAIALLIMTQLTSIQLAWETSLLLGAGIGIVLVLRWLWWRMNAWGEISAIVASLVLAPVLLTTIPAEQEVLRMLLVALGSTVTAVVVVFLTGPEEQSRLREFYRRARPPGFWGPVAESLNEEAGLGQRRLQRALAAMLVSAFFHLLLVDGDWVLGWWGVPRRLGSPGVGRGFWFCFYWDLASSRFGGGWDSTSRIRKLAEPAAAPSRGRSWCGAPITRLLGVGVVAQEREGAVELLQQDHARQLVRHGHLREREQQGGFFFGLFREAFRASQQEDQLVVPAVDLPGEPASELLRVWLFPAASSSTTGVLACLPRASSTVRGPPSVVFHSTISMGEKCTMRRR